MLTGCLQVAHTPVRHGHGTLLRNAPRRQKGALSAGQGPVRGLPGLVVHTPCVMSCEKRRGRWSSFRRLESSLQIRPGLKGAGHPRVIQLKMFQTYFGPPSGSFLTHSLPQRPEDEQQRGH